MSSERAELGLSFSYLLLDVEGTISSLSFVKKVLFPYSLEKIPSFLQERAWLAETQELLREVQSARAAEGLEGDSLPAITETLQNWVKEDRKHPALKRIQGWIWKEAFECGEFRSPLYPDVLPCLRRIQGRGKRVGIYSSGSKEAQQLFFRYSEYGDLRRYFEHFFDLAQGSKKDALSYQRICQAISLPASEILFVSDVQEELVAAQKIGFEVRLMLRPGSVLSQSDKTILIIQDLNDL